MYVLTEGNNFLIILFLFLPASFSRIWGRPSWYCSPSARTRLFGTLSLKTFGNKALITVTDVKGRDVCVLVLVSCSGRGGILCMYICIFICIYVCMYLRGGTFILLFSFSFSFFRRRFPGFGGGHPGIVPHLLAPDCLEP